MNELDDLQSLVEIDDAKVAVVVSRINLFYIHFVQSNSE